MSDKYKATFGGIDCPLRASLLPTLFACSKSFWIKTMGDGQFESNEYADTGSMVHLGIQLFHTLKGDEVAARAAIFQSVKELYRHGNPDEAVSQFSAYVKREKADQRGEVIESEKEIKLQIAPHEIDHTGEMIHIWGTIDQIRRAGDWYYVVDFKTGQMHGINMVQSYFPQMVTYMYGVMQLFGTTKVKGFIARTRDLISSRNPFYWPIDADADRCEAFFDYVAYKVAMIRKGILDVTPGKHCEYCNDLRYYPNCIDNKGQTRPPKQTPTEVKRGRVSLAHVASATNANPVARPRTTAAAMFGK